MPRVGPACAVSKLSGTFDENELKLAASPGPRRAGSSIDPTSADKIKKLEAALEQVLVFFTFFLLPSGGEMRSTRGARPPRQAQSSEHQSAKARAASSREHQSMMELRRYRSASGLA